MTAPVVDPVRPAPMPAPERRPQPNVRPSGRPDLRVIDATAAANEAARARYVRLLIISVVVGIALCVFALVVAHVVLTQNQFRLDELQEQSLEREAEYDRLRLQVAELESPDRIVAAATERGMITPPKVTYLPPTVEEPVASGSTASSLPQPSDRTGRGEASWSTVKPHLADG